MKGDYVLADGDVPNVLVCVCVLAWGQLGYVCTDPPGSLDMKTEAIFTH